MTTPPKARRFNITTRSAARALASPSAVASTVPPGAPRIELVKKSRVEPVAKDKPDAARSLTLPTDATDDGFGDQRFPGAAPRDDQPAGAQRASIDAKETPSDPESEGKLAAIRAENLTQRQLRIAARIAALHQIKVGSDEEAVLRLRERGIDPSHRAAVSQILSAEGQRAQARPAANAPAVVQRKPVPAPAAKPAPAPAPLPSREALTEERRAAEITRIQRDLARRRRRRMYMMLARLAFFVLLPTAIAGWYYSSVASPLYSTKSQFQIQMADGPVGAQGSALSGMGLGTNTDAVAVQSYLTSRDAMLRLDNELEFRAAFQQPDIDPIQRLDADASNEATYKVYQKSVKIGYDPTEGVINMEVIAPDPALSEAFSLALIRYAEGKVDQFTARLRSDQMQGAVENYDDAEAKVREAQIRVQQLQQQMGVLDATAEGGLVMTQISTLEGQRTEKELALAQYLDNARPNQSRVDALRAEIARLEEKIAATRAQLTESTADRASLAAITGQLRIAEGELQTRQTLLAASAEAMEQARIEANKQVRYLSLSIRPVPPDEPSYPKAFQNTLVAFLIFSGIYLMMSLTASILREQVSS